MKIEKLKDIEFDQVRDSLMENNAIYVPIEFAHVHRKVMLKAHTPYQTGSPVVDTITDDDDVWDSLPHNRPVILVGLRYKDSPVTSSLLEFSLGPPSVQPRDLEEIDALHVPTTVVVGIRYILAKLRRRCAGVDITTNDIETDPRFIEFCVNNRRVWARYGVDMPSDVKRAIVGA